MDALNRTLKQIDELIEDYNKLIKKAMDENDTLKVHQFCGSLVALDIVKQTIECEQRFEAE